MNFQKGFSVVLSVIIILALLGGGLYLWQKNKLAKNDYNIADVPDEPIVADETKDWKTYQNEKYGFEFKYPASIGDPLGPINFEGQSEARFLGDKDFSLYVTVGAYFSQNYTDDTLLVVSNYHAVTREGEDYKWVGVIDPKVELDSFNKDKPNNFIVLGVTGIKNEDRNREIKDLLNQIVSTFKFTN